ATDGAGLDRRNTARSNGVSDQIGRFVTASSTPVYEARKKPARPPSTLMITPRIPGGRSHARPRRCSSGANAPRKDRNEKPPKISRPQAPKDIGEEVF